MVIGLRRVDGPLDAGRLGESAGRLRHQERGSLQRFKQLCSGRIDQCHCIAEGQHRVDIFLRHIALFNGSADAAAVDDSDDRIGFHLFNAAFLDNRPDHRVGNQVAHVGFFGTVAGSPFTVQPRFRGCEYLSVFLIHPVDDLLRVIPDFPIDEAGRVQVVCDQGREQEIALDALVLIVDHDHADVGKPGAGGLNGFAALAGRHRGMAVSVQNHIDTGYLLQQFPGAGSVAQLLDIHPQVEQAEHQVAIRPDPVHCFPGDFRHLFGGGKGEHPDQAGVDLGHRLRRIHAHEADLQTALRGDDGGRRQNTLAGFIQRDVRTDHREQGFGDVFLQLGIAKVELMVSDGRHVVLCGIHHLNGA